MSVKMAVKHNEEIDKSLPSVSAGIMDLIGNTPMMEVTKFDTGLCRLFLKLENQNPGGSIKDRIALYIIEDGEKSGALKSGGHIIEATAGNTGLGLALIAAQKGYKLTLVVPDKMSREKIAHCRALGAEIIITRSDVCKGHPDYYQDIAARLVKETGAFHANQFCNPANPRAHYETTGPEIFAQMDGNVDSIVCGVGSGGTMTGLGQYFKEVSPKTEIILADPSGSILAPLVNSGKKVKPGSWIIEGVGDDFVPDNADMAFLKKAYSVSDEESIRTARLLLTKEGILAGSSSGTLLAAALQYCREQTVPKRVVTFVCDTGSKYLSKMFNLGWLVEHGFYPRAVTGGVRDLVTRRYEDGEAVTVAVTDTLKIAYTRMRTADVSQVPVLDKAGHIIGLIDESDLLKHIGTKDNKAEAFQSLVSEAMVTSLDTLQATEPVEALFPLFARDEVAIILDGDKFLGLVTRADLINHYLLQSKKQ